MRISSSLPMSRLVSELLQRKLFAKTTMLKLNSVKKPVVRLQKLKSVLLNVPLLLWEMSVKKRTRLARATLLLKKRKERLPLREPIVLSVVQRRSARSADPTCDRFLMAACAHVVHAAAV